MKKIVLFLALIVIVLGGVKLIKNKNDALEATPTAQKPIFSVNVVNAEQKKVKETRSFIAKLESNNAPELTTKVSGFIKHLHVSENQSVQKGDLLVEIDSKELQESLKQVKNSMNSMEASIGSVKITIASLQIDLKASKNSLERNRILYKVGGLSKEKFEYAGVEYQLKKAKLDSTLKNIEAKEYELQSIKNLYNSKQAGLEYYNIKSPINGFVGNIMLKNGDMALAGKTILTLLGESQKLTFSFSNKEIKKDLEVIINNSQKTKITKVLKESDNFLYVAQVDLNTPLNQPIGSFVNVQVMIKELSATALPLNTILNKSDGSFIVVYENGNFTFKKVEVLVQGEDYVITKENITQKVALASESKLAILPSSDNYVIVEE